MKHLDDLILRMLLEEPRSGYAIAKEIEARTGWKPSWGSIYPALERLQEEGIVQAEEHGRGNIFSLTSDGSIQAEERLGKSKELLEGIIERLRILQAVTGEDMSRQIQALSAMAEGQRPFLPIEKPAERMQQELFRLWENGLLAPNRKEISRIITDASKALEDIR